MDCRIAIAGATGLVGRRLLAIMEAEDVPTAAIGLFASAASAGTSLDYMGSPLTVSNLAACDFSNYNAAIFCVGDELSAQYVPLALDAGCAVVDKSNAFRLDADVPLTVAGVNDAAISSANRLVANPNCTTIVLSHGLAPLESAFGIRSIWAATYQSASGAGKGAAGQLRTDVQNSGYESADDLSEIGDPESLAFNTHSRVGRMKPNGQCSEETKLVAETRKILGRTYLPVIAHTVRVPVLIGHGIAVTISFDRELDQQAIESAWAAAPDVKYMADGLPTPVGSSRHDQVEVGRLRKEPDLENGWSFFVCGDNINIGAALNGWRLLKLMQAAGTVPQFRKLSGGI